MSNDLNAPSPAQKLAAGTPSNPLHGSTGTNGKHDHLALLIDSRNPIITVETKEEHRLQDLLLDVTTKMCVPLYTWTVTAGLARLNGTAVYGTDQPEQALANIALIEGNAIVLLKDLHVTAKTIELAVGCATWSKNFGPRDRLSSSPRLQ